MIDLRDAFMAGYIRRKTWCQYAKENPEMNTQNVRDTYMAGYIRQTTWEAYKATL